VTTRMAFPFVTVAMAARGTCADAPPESEFQMGRKAQNPVIRRDPRKLIVGMTCRYPVSVPLSESGPNFALPGV
jgi:hypothetical protein